MKRQIATLLSLTSLLLLSSVGCQPGKPLDLYGSSQYGMMNGGYQNSQYQRTNQTNQTNTNYDQWFSQMSSKVPDTTTASQIAAGSSACTSSTQAVQRLINGCEAEINYNYSDIQQQFPNCLNAFYNLAPSYCATLKTQVENLSQACKTLITQYSQYFPNCYNAFRNF